ncbi:flippase [Patescibacteria group bacterium]
MGGKVAKNTAYLTSAFVGQKVLSFVYFTIIARTVGVDGAGRYFIAVSFTTIWSVFVDLGLANVLVREVAKFPEKAQKLFANVLGMKVILAILSVLGANLTARLLGYPGETRLMIMIASAVMVLDSTHLVLYAVMRGYQNLKYEAIGVVSGQAVTITVGGTFLVMGLPLPFLILALLCGSTWNVIWSAWSLKRKFGVLPMFRLDGSVVRFFWSVTIPFALAGIFSRVYSYIDSIMLSKLISETSVGLYSVAYKIAFAFQFVPMAFAAAIYPAMSEYYVMDREKLGRLFAFSLKYLLALAMPLAFGIATLATPIIIAVYGIEFAGSILPLQVLMFSLVFAFLYWPAGSLLNACDRQAKNTLVMGLTMVGNIVLNAILIPRLSATGAAISALFGNMILFVGAFTFAHGLAPWHKRILVTASVKIFLSSVLMGAAILVLRPYVHFLLLIPVGVVVYGGAVLMTGGITRKEMQGIFSTFLRKGRGVSDIVS